MADGLDLPGRPLWAEIDLDALEANLAALRSHLPGTTAVCAVVKANAYGHGAVLVARALQAAGVERLGVATVDEGVQLRDAGVTVPVLLMGALAHRDAGRAVQAGLTVTVDSVQMARVVAREAGTAGARTPVHVKIDTGMHRFGVAPGEAAAVVAAVQGETSLELEGLWTHFANADEADKSFVRTQYARFQRACAGLPDVPLRHVANSATCLDLPELALDMVRPGIVLYGVYPSPEVGHDVALEPVLSLRAEVVRVHGVGAGETVSYGRTWQAGGDARIGLVPLGYADGYRRGLSNRAAMLLRGRRVPVVGRVTMDQVMVDVSAVAGAEPGERITVYGRDGEAAITVDEVAALEGTIPYEITCAISARVPRVAVRSGRAEAIHTLVGEHEPPARALRPGYSAT